jgi:hypothetical protein
MRRNYSFDINIEKDRYKSTKIKDLRVSKTHHLSLSNYNPKIIKDKINRIRKTINSYNQKNIKLSNELVNNTKKVISKKSLIISLCEDLDYHKTVNDSFMAYEKYAIDLCNGFKKNFEDILIYKVNLTRELKDFIELMKEYEETEKVLIKEKELIKQSNEDIIKYKLEEQNKLNKQLKQLNEDLNKQNLTLTELNDILNNNLNINQNNLQNLQNEELKYNEKLEVLEKSYKKLIVKYNYYEDIISNARKKLYKDDSILEKEEMNEADIKLKEEIIKNNYLNKIINDIKKKMNQIQTVNKNRYIRLSSLKGEDKNKNGINKQKINHNKFDEITTRKMSCPSID